MRSYKTRACYKLENAFWILWWSLLFNKYVASLSVTPAVRAATTIHLKRTMRPWARRKPVLFTKWTPTLVATITCRTTPLSLMISWSADRGWTESRNSNTSKHTPRPAWASAHPSPPAACQLRTANRLRSLASLIRALPAAGRAIPTACCPVWARKITPAVLGKAASPDTSTCPSPTDTAPTWAAWSSRSLCTPTRLQLICVTIPCLRTRVLRRELPVVLSALQMPTTGGLWSSNTPGLRTIQLTAPTVKSLHLLCTSLLYHLPKFN